MKYTTKQVNTIHRLIEAQKQQGLKLTQSANRKLNAASRHFSNAAEMLRRLEEAQAKPELRVIDGDKE